MANRRHVEIVMSGLDALFEWQEQNPDERLDLVDADLRQATFSEGYDRRRAANLTFADLRGANLSGLWLMQVKFLGAKLVRANLSGCVLSAGNFDSADMTEANVSDTAWNDAYVSSTNMTNAIFHRAGVNYPLFSSPILRGADFDKAKFSGVIFKDVDLSEVKNLETVWHMFPSTIGVDTIYRSHGLIPEIFLRGCGLPESFIKAIPELIHSQSINERFSCFVSYSTVDEEFANKLYARLVSDNVRVWYAPHDMKGGKTIYDQIYKAIRNFDKTLLVLSEHSMNSPWVETEIRNAMDVENPPFVRRLFPIRLTSMANIKAWKLFNADTGADLAVKVREYHIPDFSNWREQDAFEKAYARLLDDLRAYDL